MASGTPLPAECTEMPTFSALRQSSVPIGIEVYNLHLYREKIEGGRELQYYILVNGHRIKPLDLETKHDEQKALQWFDDVFGLYMTARIRNHGPFD